MHKLQEPVLRRLVFKTPSFQTVQQRAGLYTGARRAAQFGLGWFMAAAGGAYAGEVSVAVAANFTAPMAQIAADFEKSTGHKAVLSYGATGRFYAQISNGAPFDVLLAADTATPAKLVHQGKATGASNFTYAIGRLALWSAAPGLVDAHGDVLTRGQFRYVAIAAPLLSPYGAAAMQTLDQLGWRAAIEPKLVTGESVGQVFSMVATGNAELGFVALSQIFENGKLKSGSAWVVPDSLHSPIKQNAILLSRGQSNPAAAALLAYLATDKAKAVITSFGYEVPSRK
jgi:molybdate transport system substrate-binding protein